MPCKYDGGHLSFVPNEKPFPILQCDICGRKYHLQEEGDKNEMS